MDEIGRVTEVNRALETMIGRPREEIIGTAGPFSWWQADEQEEIVAKLTAQLATGGGRHEFEFMREDGNVLPVCLDLMWLDGVPESGLVATVRDLSSHGVERGRRLDAERMAGICTWEWNPRTDALRGSTGLLSATGIEPAQSRTMEDFLAFLPHPDDERVRAVLGALAAGDRDECSIEHRFEAPNPDFRWMQLQAHGVRGEAGAVVRVVGVTQDVTARRDSADALQDSRELSEMAERIAAVGSFEVEDGSGAVRWSGNLYRLFGVDPVTPVSQRVAFRSIQADDLPGFQAVRGRVRADGVPRTIDHRYRRGEELRWAETRFEPLRRDGEIVGIRGTLQDITERRRGEHERRLQAHLLDAVDAAVIATGLDGRVTHWNARAEGLYGWTAEEAVGEPISTLVTPSDPAKTEALMTAIDASGTWNGSYEVEHKDGTPFSVLVQTSVYSDERGEALGLIGTSMDLSDRVDHEERVTAARDYLLAVTDSIGEGVFTLDEEGRLIYINPAAQDMLGWRAQELEGKVLHEVTHYRHGDGSDYPMDECPILHSRVDRRTVRMDQDLFIAKDGTEIPVEYISSPIQTEAGLQGCVVVFDDISERLAHGEEIDRRIASLSWIGRIHDALKRDLLVVHAQPIVDLRSGSVAQHELVIRMRDADGSLIPPGDFLPVAEEFGVIGEIDRWMTEQAVELAAGGDCVHLNLSAHSMGDAQAMKALRAGLERTGADPSNIVVELTETALMEHEKEAEQFAEDLKAIGCRLALDDFGTGFGGFSYLKRLPVDYLKIDREFVSDLIGNAASQHVVTAVVNLAAAFGQKTVAEGVEDEMVLKALRELGVDYAQGFHVGRPGPIGRVFEKE